MSTPLPYPALHASHAGIWLSQAGGEARAIDRKEAIRLAADTPLILLGSPLVGARLGYPDLSGLDVLELFAFVHPARFAVPTPKGLAKMLKIAVDDDGGAAVPMLLLTIAQKLFDTLVDPAWPEREGAWDAAQGLARALDMGWRNHTAATRAAKGGAEPIFTTARMGGRRTAAAPA